MNGLICLLYNASDKSYLADRDVAYRSRTPGNGYELRVTPTRSPTTGATSPSVKTDALKLNKLNNNEKKLCLVPSNPEATVAKPLEPPKPPKENRIPAHNHNLHHHCIRSSSIPPSFGCNWSEVASPYLILC